MRIAVDIDSTLHPGGSAPYSPLRRAHPRVTQLAAIAKQRFGVELPYEEQVSWGSTLLLPEQFAACVEETHTSTRVLAAEPYPGAVDAIRAWHDAGHFIHITSHRPTDAYDATARWLERIGLPHDELYCSWDKITRCSEIAVDVLIDDSPDNLVRAAAAGITPATIVHPWNRELCEEEDIVCAPDWPTLATRLQPLLARVA